MKRIAYLYLILFAFVVACKKDPITGRRPMKLLNEQEVISMSFNQYSDFVKKNPVLPESDERVKLVRKLGFELKKSVEDYCREKKVSDRLKGYSWEFNVVDSKQINAWCMPGGKIVVYTGLLPVTQNEKALAAVMGHEVAHAICRHGNERMSQTIAAQTTGNVLSVVLTGSGVSGATKDIFLQSYGVTSTLGLLKYSRKHESEADKLGLIFMAMAGYDPTEAIAFWQRMSQASGGGTLEILSTHPSDERRIADIKKFLPTAMKYYKKK